MSGEVVSFNPFGLFLRLFQGLNDLLIIIILVLTIIILLKGIKTLNIYIENNKKNGI